jgi:hypothetical protein
VSTAEKSIIEDIIKAAANHGRDSEPDHEVGDLQDLLRVAWKIMEPTQRIRLWNHETTAGILNEWGGD